MGKEEIDGLDLRDFLIIEDLTDGIWKWNAQTNKGYFSAAGKRALGYEDHEITDTLEGWISLMHPEDAEGVIQTLDQYLNKKIDKYEVRFRAKTKDNRYIWILDRGQAVWDDKGRPVYIVGIHTNIHEQQETKEALKDSENLYRALFETCPEPIVIYKDLEFVYANSACTGLYGVENLKDLLGRSILDFTYPKNNEEIREKILHSMKEEKVKDYNETKMIDMHGNVKDVEVVSTIVHYQGEKLVLSILRDVTKRNEMYAFLQESEEKYRNISEFSPNAQFIHDMGRIIYANDATVKLLGAKCKGQMVGRHIYDFIHSDFRLISKKRISQVQNKNKIAPLTEMKFIRLDGEIIDAEAVTTPIPYKGTNLALTIVGDITERKKMERELKAFAELNEKLVSHTLEYDRLKTEFFSNISHELKTPLNIILGVVQLLTQIHQNEIAMNCEYYRSFNKYVRIMKQNCFRLLKLINNLIDITRLDAGFLTMDFKNQDIISVVEDITLSVAEYVESKGIELIFDTNVEEKILACDVDKIERIILNLLSNAIKFTPSKGMIRVNIEVQEELVRIEVKDSGVGIPEDKLEAIFQRFRQVEALMNRTTEGSGIGLSLVKALIEAHGGRISVESEYGKGSTFIMEIPVRLVEENGHEEVASATQCNVERISIEFADIYS